ncbi:MAG: response regulator [Phycisphaerales bacterium]|nr:response regulator [Phycisphaerales bacterium]
MQSVRTILVVDDEPAIVHVVAMKFTQCGFRVLTAWNGSIALEIVRANEVDLIISDFQMPILDGMQLAAALRADTRTCNIPVIVLTARGHLLGDDWEGASNVRHVVSKPFSPRELVAMSERVLADDRGRAAKREVA